MHRPVFEGLFSEEMTSLKKLLMESGIKEAQPPLGLCLCLGPWLKLDSSGIEQQRRLWFGLQDTVSISEMSRSIAHWKACTIISCASSALFKPLKCSMSQQNRIKMDFFFSHFSLIFVTGQDNFFEIGINFQISSWVFLQYWPEWAWQGWHVREILGHISLKHQKQHKWMLSNDECSPNIHPSIHQ